MTVEAALCAMYQPLAPKVALSPGATWRLTVDAIERATGTSPLPTSPVDVFLEGGCAAFRTAHTHTAFDADRGEYVCVRTPVDPVVAAVEAAVVPGPHRDAILDAVQSRLCTTWQRAFLEHAVRVQADARVRINLAHVLQSKDGDVGTDSGGTRALLKLALAGLLEASGAVSSGYFTDGDVAAISALIANGLQNVGTPQACAAKMARAIHPRHLKRLQQLGLQLFP